MKWSLTKYCGIIKKKYSSIAASDEILSFVALELTVDILSHLAWNYDM